jgi:hypothetical protein
VYRSKDIPNRTRRKDEKQRRLKDKVTRKMLHEEQKRRKYILQKSGWDSSACAGGSSRQWRINIILFSRAETLSPRHQQRNVYATTQLFFFGPPPLLSLISTHTKIIEQKPCLHASVFF